MDSGKGPGVWLGIGVCVCVWMEGCICTLAETGPRDCSKSDVWKIWNPFGVARQQVLPTIFIPAPVNQPLSNPL